MIFNWDGFTEKDFADFCAKMENGIGVCAENCVGAVRVGDLCFDLLLRLNDSEGLNLYDRDGMHLVADLYIGGVDDGYGYGIDDYPYTFSNDGFETADTCIWMDYDSFKTWFESEAVKVIDRNNVRDKAEQPLHVW